MIHSTGFVFIFLLVLATQNSVECFADYVTRSLSYREKSNDFAECVFQNIAETPVFSQKEKEYIKLTVDNLVPSVSTKDRGGTNDIQLKKLREVFAFSVAEKLALNNEINHYTTVLKSADLTAALEMCCRTSLECTNKEFIAKIRDYIREQTMDIAVDENINRSRYPSETISSYEGNSLSKQKRSIQPKESITITNEDIRSCANAVKANLKDDEAFVPCRKIFNRGVWDKKADRTLDKDTQKLMTLIYDDKRENLEKVLDFIDNFVPRYVRELIVSYHTIIENLKRNGEFNLTVNSPHFLRIKNEVSKIKHMNGNHYAEKYFFAKQIHKNMLEDMLISLHVVENEESVSVTNTDIQDCADSIKRYLLDESRAVGSCSKIYSRGISDNKADKTLDGDVRKLISLIYDGKGENLARVLYFIDQYVPKHVRELVVSYDSVINESEKNKDLNLEINLPFLLEIRDAVTAIKHMNGDNPDEKYENAKQVYKDMLENILKSLKIPKGEDFSVTNDNIQNCANSVKLDLGNESSVLASCSNIFNTDVPEKTSDDDIRKLISLIYDNKKVNMPKVLYFLKKYGPKSVRERIVSYDSIINEFEKSGDLKATGNQPYFGTIKNEMKAIKKMNGSSPAENYENVAQIYKDMLENVLEGYAVKESTTITKEDIRICANAVKNHLDDDHKMLVSCAHIFNRGVWDAKADATLDGDIEKLIPLSYGGERKNVVKVLIFISEYIPKFVRELIVSYDALINEFEKYDDFSLPENQPYFQEIYKVVTQIKDMDGNHPAEQYSLALQRHKDMLENMLQTLEEIKTKISRQ